MVVRALGHPRTELATIGAPPLQMENDAANGNVIAQGETREPVIAWPAGLPLGYHRLTLTDAKGVTEEVPLIVAPERAFAGDFDRGWLIAVQLYGVLLGRATGAWAISVISMQLIRLASSLGADGIPNPLHALFDDRPGDCSPYAPNSRLFLNALYVDAEKAPPGYPGDCLMWRDAAKKLRQTTARRLIPPLPP